MPDNRIAEQYRRPLQWFPDVNEEGSLDAAITELVRERLRVAFALRKPTLVNMSAALGMDRERLARLIDRLDLSDEWREIKREDQRKRAEERAAARAESRENDGENQSQGESVSA